MLARGTFEPSAQRLRNLPVGSSRRGLQRRRAAQQTRAQPSYRTKCGRRAGETGRVPDGTRWSDAPSCCCRTLELFRARLWPALRPLVARAKSCQRGGGGGGGGGGGAYAAAAA